MNEPDFVIISGEEDFTDTDSMKTGADSPELVDTVPDKDNLRYISQPSVARIKLLNSYYYSQHVHVHVFPCDQSNRRRATVGVTFVFHSIGKTANQNNRKPLSNLSIMLCIDFDMTRLNLSFVFSWYTGNSPVRSSMGKHCITSCL